MAPPALVLSSLVALAPAPEAVEAVDRVAIEVAIEAPAEAPPVVAEDVEAMPIEGPPVVAPGPAPVFTPVGDGEAWKRDYVRVIPPRYRGTGQLVIAGLFTGSVLIKQLALAIVCDDPGCDLLRGYDRVALLGAVALTATGMRSRGRSNAYRDALVGAPRPTQLQARRRNGWILAGGGAALFAADALLHAACLIGRGPYVLESSDAWVWPRCGGWVGSAMMDVGGGMMGVGLGLVTMSRKYRRDRDIYDQGRVALAPQLGRGLAGVALTGRF